MCYLTPPTLPKKRNFSFISPTKCVWTYRTHFEPHQHLGFFSFEVLGLNPVLVCAPIQTSSGLFMWWALIVAMPLDSCLSVCDKMSQVFSIKVAPLTPPSPPQKSNFCTLCLFFLHCQGIYPVQLTKCILIYFDAQVTFFTFVFILCHLVTPPWCLTPRL